MAELDFDPEDYIDKISSAALTKELVRRGDREVIGQDAELDFDPEDYLDEISTIDLQAELRSRNSSEIPEAHEVTQDVSEWIKDISKAFTEQDRSEFVRQMEKIFPQYSLEIGGRL